MTWIIGTPFIFGYSALIGDVQASLKDDNGKILACYDSVQKIYPLSYSLISGFAGNIRLGFAITQAMRDFLKLPDEVKRGRWYPEHLIEELPKVMRKRHEQLCNRFGHDDVEFIIAGVHPNKCVPKDTDWKLPYCYIFRSNNYFQPEEVGLGQIDSIGSGSGQVDYVRELESLQDPEAFVGFVQFESTQKGGYAQLLMHLITLSMNKNPVRGISQHLLLFMATPEEFPNDVVWANNNREAFGQWGEFKMPHVATSWEEFERLWKKLSDNNSDASACIG